MAKINGNHFLKNVRGMLGKQLVYKSRLGTPYVAVAPEVDENRIATQEEQSNRDRFAEAVIFARQAVKDPELKKEYAALAKKVKRLIM